MSKLRYEGIQPNATQRRFAKIGFGFYMALDWAVCFMFLVTLIGLCFLAF